VNDSSPWPDTTASRVDGDLADSPLMLLTSAALLELLAAPANGAVVLMDDAQWMDSASLEVLAFAVRRLDR
jgi:predicted ATPase